MASGDIKPVVTDPDALPLGHVVTTSGRISAARTPGSVAETPPFARDELVALDEALSNATETAGVRFSIYIGDLGGDPVSKAGGDPAAGARAGARRARRGLTEHQGCRRRVGSGGRRPCQRPRRPARCDGAIAGFVGTTSSTASSPRCVSWPRRFARS